MFQVVFSYYTWPWLCLGLVEMLAPTDLCHIQLSNTFSSNSLHTFVLVRHQSYSNMRKGGFVVLKKGLWSSWVWLYLAGADTFLRLCESLGKKHKSSILDRSTSLNICNESRNFLTHVYFYTTEKPKWHSLLSVSCWKGSPGVPQANKTCPECAFIAMQNKSSVLQVHLRPYFQLQCHEHLELTGLYGAGEQSGTCCEVPNWLKNIRHFKYKTTPYPPPTHIPQKKINLIFRSLFTKKHCQKT